MALFGPDFNLDFNPFAHRAFTVPPGRKAKTTIWGDGVIEQGLMLYQSDYTALAIMRTSPGIDDAFGAQMRSGERLLEPGGYIIGGYNKYNNQWRSSGLKVWEESADHVVFGFDDVGNQGKPGDQPGDGDYNDAMIRFDFVVV